MRFVSVSFLFLVDDLICRFLRSLVTAQTNRYALRLARDSAPRGTMSRSPAFTPIGLWSYSCRTGYYVPLPQVDDQRSSFDGSPTYVLATVSCGAAPAIAKAAGRARGRQES